MAQDTSHATQHKTSREHTGEQEQSRLGHLTQNTMQGASTPVYKRRMAQDTAHATQCTERAHL